MTRAVARSRLLGGDTFINNFEEWLGTYIDCSLYVSPTMVGRRKRFLKPRPLKVGFIIANF